MAGLLRYEIRVVGSAKATRQIQDLDAAVEKVADGMNRIDGSTTTLARGFDETAEAAKAADKAFAKAAAAQNKLGQGSRQAGKEVEGFGRQFDGLNDRLNKTWGRAGDVISRVGDLEDMIRIFSGFVLLDAVQTAGAFVEEMYAMTDAGRKAQSMAEGLAEGLKKITNGLDNVDIRKAVQLAAAMGKSKEQTSEYQRALDAAIDRQVELNAELEKKARLEKEGKTDRFEYRNTLRNIEILTKAVEDQISVAEVEKKKAEERAFAAGQVERALIGEAKAAKDLVPNILKSAGAIAKAAAESIAYKVSLQGSEGAMTSTIDVFARLGAAGVKTWEGISKAVAGHDKTVKKSTEEAKRASEMRLRINQDLEDRQTTLIESEGARRLAQLDLQHQRELEGFKGTGEQRKRLLGVQADEMIALERDIERRAAAEREAAAKAELDQRIAMIQQGAAEAAAATQLSMQALAGDPRAGTQEGIDAKAQLQRQAAMDAAQAEIQIAQEKGESIAEIELELQAKLLKIEQERVAASKQSVEQLASSVGAAAAPWARWQSDAVRAVDATSASIGRLASQIEYVADQVSEAISAFRRVADAVIESEAVGLRNASQRAGEELAAAQAAERRARAEAEAAGISTAASADVAAAVERREKATWAAYEAQVAQAEAEDQAAKAKQIFLAIEMATEGLKAGAKSVESFALASFLAALPFGAGVPFIPSALTSGVLYAATAAAYGVSTGVAAAAPTPRAARPVNPEDDLVTDRLSGAGAKDTIGAGDRGRSGDGGGNTYVYFSGGALHTQQEIQDTIVRAQDEAGNRRTRRSADYSRLDRSRRRRTR